MRRPSRIINDIVHLWCKWNIYYARTNDAKYCKKCEQLNEKIADLVSELDGIFNEIC